MTKAPTTSRDPAFRMPVAVRWLAGDEGIRAAIDRLLARGEASFEVLSTNARRHVVAALLPPTGLDPTDRSDPPAPARLARPGVSPRAVVLKTHRLATGRHPFRERIKRALGRSPAGREWRALVALRAAGVPVPAPLAYGRLASGDELLVLERLPGRPFGEALLASDADDASRSRLVARLAATLDRLRASGHVHGDLQLGNLWLTPTAAGEGGGVLEAETVHLLDLQRTRRDRGGANRADGPPTPARSRDLARLELSLLRARASASLRLELRAALRIGRAADEALRRFAADSLRGRERRILRPRRGLAAIRDPRWRGECDAELDEAALLAAVAAAAAAPERRIRREGRAWLAETRIEGRAVVVKGTAADSLVERFVAGIRGSRGRRAFENGRREQLLLARSARPLAWLEERRRCGLPGASVLVLEKVGEADLDEHRPGSEAAARALAETIAEGMAELHAVGVLHADMKGSNVRIGARRDGGASDSSRSRFDFWLVDLEDLALPARPTDDARLEALAQLNASLPDAHFTCPARESALARTLAVLPFEAAALDLAGARREIVRRSRARAHRWRGEGDGGDDGGDGNGIGASSKVGAETER